MSAVTGRSFNFPDATCSRKQQPVILIADDDDMVRNFLVAVMKSEGYDVLACTDGQEGLELSRKLASKIDLIVTDLEMPHMNGVEFCAHVRAERPGVKIVIISGSGNRQLTGVAQDASFLSKPLDLPTFSATVRELLTEN